MSEDNNHKKISNGKKSIIFGIAGIILFSLSILLESIVLYWIPPRLCGLTGIIYGIFGLRKDEKRVLALVGLLLSVILLFLYSFL